MMTPRQFSWPFVCSTILLLHLSNTSVAALAGLEGGNAQTGLGGDVITGVDGRPVEEFDDLLGYIVQHTEVGQTIQLQILRDGETQTVPLTLQARPSNG